jgi:outer membrane immunogenic protein
MMQGLGSRFSIRFSIRFGIQWGASMKKLVLAGFALAALAAPALAADMRVKAPVLKAPPPPIFSWTGCYIGGNGGWKWGRFNETDTTLPVTFLGTTVSAAAVTVDGRGDSLAAGGQLGCRYETNEHVVFGLEGDVDWVDVRASTMLTDPLTPVPFVAAGPGVLGDMFRMTQRWESSIRGSIGYDVNHFLLYVTGGVAFTRVDKDAAFPALTVGGTFFPGTFGSDSHTFTGWTIGGGGAYAIDNNWDIGAEYRYTEYRNQDFNLGSISAICFGLAGNCAVTPVTGRTNLKTSEVLVKLNYRFGWFGAPLVAKY